MAGTVTLSENGTMSRRLAGGECDRQPPAALSGGTTDNTLASTIGALASYAIAFDEISEADGACYSAAAFVEWLRLETGSNGGSRGEDRTGHPSESGPLETVTSGSAVRLEPLTVRAGGPCRPGCAADGRISQTDFCR